MIKKNSLLLEDAGINKDCSLILTIIDAPARNSGAAREKRVAIKDEAKVQIIYTLRNPASEVEGKENAEESELMINTSTKKEGGA